MKSSGVRFVNDKIAELFQINSSEILHDRAGNRVEVSYEYFKNQLNKRSSHNLVQFQLAHSIISDDFKMLTIRQQQVMILLIEGISQRQIGEILNISQSAVNGHKRRAVKHLRKYIPKFKEKN